MRSALYETFPQEGEKINISLVEKWVYKGQIKQAKEDLIDLLYVRLEEVDDYVLESIDGIEEQSILKILHKQAAMSESIEEFSDTLDVIMT